MAVKPSHNDDDCNCGCIDRWMKLRGSPFIWDKRTGEYKLHLGSWESLYFCPQCGGRLPSRRDEMFTKPADAEVEEIQGLLNGTRSIDEVIAILGTADAVIPWDDSDIDEETEPAIDESNRWRRAHQYSERWETLDLQVLEMPDGSVQFVTGGKYIGP